MRNKRAACFTVVLLLIIIGILSRQTTVIPLFFGDIVYAMMVYFIIRTVFLQHAHFKIAFISLLICYLIELSQLYQASWINEIRKTLLGHYVLGQGFLWSDLIAYAFGILSAFVINKKVML